MHFIPACQEHKTTNNSKMIITIVFVISTIVLFLIAWWYLYLIKCMWKLRGVPGPTPLPIVGCSYLFPNVTSLLNAFLNLTRKYGPVCKMMVGIEPSLLISDYECLEQILRSSKLIEKSKSYRHFHNWLGLGLLTSGGVKWRTRRKMLTPSYHFNILDGFIPVFNSVSSKLVAELKEEIGKSSFDIYPYITLCTLDIICETAMGTSVNALINRDSEYVKAVKGMCNVIMEKVFSPWQHHEATFKLTKNYKREKNLLRILNDYTMNVIHHRQETIKFQNQYHNKFQTGSEVSENINKKTAFLDLLLQAKIDGEPLTDKDLCEEVSTFMFEGHDTTASALSFALYLIANHQEVQAKIIQEQKEIFDEDFHRDASFKDLNEMKYLELVIKETLRLYPSVPFYGRETQEDITINNIYIPKNFTLIIFAIGIQRNAKYYPEPDKFIPERFLETSGKFPYSFIPFSAGYRNCIGQKFAMLEMKTTLSIILRSYKLLPAFPQQEIVLISETILKSANGINLKIEVR